MPEDPATDPDASPPVSPETQRLLDARERALGLLYEADLKDRSAADVLAGLPVAPDPLTERLVSGVDTHLAEIDRDLERVSRGWSLARMPMLDRAILRMALFELRWTPEVPTPVVLNEAVELARRFSTDDSGRFVNGVLARLATDHRSASDGDERAC